MNGVDLAGMEAADFVDVLHAQFEDYFTFTSEEHLASVNGIRKSVYNNLYGKPFLFEVKTNSKTTGNRGVGGMTDASGYQAKAYVDDDFSSLDSVNPFSPRDVQRSENGEEIKPYFPPSDFDPTSDKPFAGLDGPLN